MHRKKGEPRGLVWKLILGLVLGCAASGEGTAQEAMPPAKVQAVVVPINGTKPLQVSTKQPLKDVINQDPNVARVSAMTDDPSRVLITGLKAGTTRVTLIDMRGAREAYDVVVQADVEHLRAILRQAVPSAAVQLIPTSENTLVIGGTVGRTEDIDTVMQIAQSVGVGRVINHMQVGGVSQVQLCVVVAKVSRSEFRRMAFNFLLDTDHAFVGSTVGQAVANPAVVGDHLLRVGAPGIPNGAPTNLFFGILYDHTSFLGFLQALKDENVLKLLAEPKLVTLSGRPASFLSGGEQAVPIPAGLGQVGVQFEEFGTRLNFLPVVLGNGRIHLEVEPEVSNLNAAFGTAINGTVVPGRDTQRVHTTVELEDGQTFAIGGLIQRDVTGTVEKIPVLGDLPFVGAAFSSKLFTEIESELVILVTPRLVDAMACNQTPPVLPGEETRSPDDFELFLEGILEAPRGPRDVFPCKRYVPAYKNGPTAHVLPCAGSGCGGDSGCGGQGCAAGAGAPAAPPPAHAAPAPVAPAAAAPKPEVQPVTLRDEEAPPEGETPVPANPAPAGEAAPPEKPEK
jgi:pilus assembly protein CpaC